MRARRFDQYDLDQLDEALARFATLRADPMCIPPNAATRAIDRWIERARARDGAAVRALVAPDAVFEDRRGGLRGRGGREEVVGYVGRIAPAAIASTRTVLAAGGDRFVLESLHAGGEETFHVVEVDADERIAAAVVLDGESRLAATREIYERYARSADARHLPPALFEAGRAVMDHEFDACATRCPPISISRTTGGRVGPDGRRRGAYIESLHAMVALTPDWTLENLYAIASDTRGWLDVARVRGSLSDGGGQFENVLVRIVLFRDGRLNLMEFFEPEDLDLARARYAELEAAAANQANGAGASPAMRNR
jgi:hypothetical protein